MTKKILSLFIIMTAMGLVACQRQGSTNGTFHVGGYAPVVPSQFNFRVDAVTNKGYAELIIYQKDSNTIDKKYTFNFSTDHIASQTKGNDEIHKISARSNEDPSILAHIIVTEAPIYKDAGASIETWLQTASEVSLVQSDPNLVTEPDISVGMPLVVNSEHAGDKMLGKHEGKSAAFESSEPKKSPSERSLEDERYQRRFDPRRPLK
ncbi:MAG: hypothetical protein HYY62_02620 [Deltaproteobacteria bacterium]|nr:hypothetical protein [Deltaproteobacteria bacterium]